MLAFQLRMLRRRGVIPTLASFGVLLLAFVFSVVLAFAQSDEDRTTSNLTLGLLYFIFTTTLVVSTVHTPLHDTKP
jgi:hypothetical protein